MYNVHSYVYMLYIAVFFIFLTYLFASTHVHRVFSVPEAIADAWNAWLLPGTLHHTGLGVCSRSLPAFGFKPNRIQTVHVLPNMEPWSLHPL